MHFTKTKINSPNSFIKNELGELFWVKDLYSILTCSKASYLGAFFNWVTTFNPYANIPYPINELGNHDFVNWISLFLLSKVYGTNVEIK